MPKPTSLAPPAIRKARAADLPAVLAIEREQFTNPWAGEHFQAELDNSFSHFYVAGYAENSAPAGFMIFWRLGDELELHKIAVARAWQRRGCGAALLDFFIRRARSWHCRHALLEVRAGNEAAVRLYEKASFQCIGRRRDYYSRPTEDALVFERLFKADGPPVKGSPAPG
jgi:ribosomal-protein-alanine N-acetyltransferase